MTTPAAQVARSIRAMLPNAHTPQGQLALKALLFKHRHLIAATLERAALPAETRRP